MQIAAMTSQAALIVSPRLSATMPNDTAPRAAIPVHKSFDCVPFPLMRSMVTTFLPRAAVGSYRPPTSYGDKVPSCVHRETPTSSGDLASIDAHMHSALLFAVSPPDGATAEARARDGDQLIGAQGAAKGSCSADEIEPKS